MVPPAPNAPKGTGVRIVFEVRLDPLTDVLYQAIQADRHIQDWDCDKGLDEKSIASPKNGPTEVGVSVSFSGGSMSGAALMGSESGTIQVKQSFAQYHSTKGHCELVAFFPATLHYSHSKVATRINSRLTCGSIPGERHPVARNLCVCSRRISLKGQ